MLNKKNSLRTNIECEVEREGMQKEKQLEKIEDGKRE
jgi:hypothetical protein